MKIILSNYVRVLQDFITIGPVLFNASNIWIKGHLKALMMKFKLPICYYLFTFTLFPYIVTRIKRFQVMFLYNNSINQYYYLVYRVHT